MIFRIADRRKLLMAALPILGILVFVIVRYVQLDWIIRSSTNTKVFGVALLLVSLGVVVFFSKKFGVDYEFRIEKGYLHINKNSAHFITMPVAELVMLKVFENNGQYFVKLFDANGKNFFSFNNAFTKIPLADVVSFFETHVSLISSNETYSRMGGRKIDFINKKYMK